MLFAVNDDTPGMIGKIGTILGEAGVNIANMAVSRNRRERRALMALSLDNPVPDEVLDRLHGESGFSDARFIVLPEPAR
jgi:D-3-phosphoglycerate dehydrogenase